MRIQLAIVLSLSVDGRKAGCELAERILAEENLEGFASVRDPHLDYIAGRVGISVSQMPVYIKDNLLRLVGSYYLNRPRSEGGPDLQKAADIFASISASELRLGSLADQRLSNITPQPQAPKRSASVDMDESFEGSSAYERRKRENLEGHLPNQHEKNSITMLAGVIVLLSGIGLYFILMRRKE